MGGAVVREWGSLEAAVEVKEKAPALLGMAPS
jgi:hypothetical protein